MRRAALALEPNTLLGGLVCRHTKSSTYRGLTIDVANDPFGIRKD